MKQSDDANERLEKELHVAQMNSLLQIMLAVNSDIDEKHLYSLYKNTLKQDLNVPKMLFLVKDTNSKWIAASRIDFDELDEESISEMAEDLSRQHTRTQFITYGLKQKYRLPFDYVVPNRHRGEAIGFTLFEKSPIVIEQISFLLSFSSIVASTVSNKRLKIQKEKIEKEILREKQDITLATINLKGYSELQTSILQYWAFFDEYIKKTKGISFNFSAKRFDEGIELSVEINDKMDNHKLNEYFVEYASILSQNNIDVRNNFDVDVLVAEINHLNKQLELQQQLMMQNLQLTQKLIGERKDFASISLVPEIVESFKDKVKYYIGKDQLREAINELYVNSRATDHENEVVLLKSNFNRIKRLERSNLADINQLNIEYSKIKSSVLDLLNEL